MMAKLKGNVLVVDDEASIRDSLRSVLEYEGYNVLDASRGPQALDLLKTERVDAVLLDIKMPKVNGSVMYDVIEQFHRSLKVIVASIYPLDVQKRVIPGACDYYDKSQGTELLVRKVNNALQN